MFEDLYTHVRLGEVESDTRTIAQRMTVEEYARMDRLEAALVKARARIHWPLTTTTLAGR